MLRTIYLNNNTYLYFPPCEKGFNATFLKISNFLSHLERSLLVQNLYPTQGFKSWDSARWKLKYQRTMGKLQKFRARWKRDLKFDVLASKFWKITRTWKFADFCLSGVRGECFAPFLWIIVHVNTFRGANQDATQLFWKFQIFGVILNGHYPYRTSTPRKGSRAEIQRDES